MDRKKLIEMLSIAAIGVAIGVACWPIWLR